MASALVRHPAFMRAGRVAAYLANDGEIDPARLVQRAWTSGRQVYLPVLVDRPRPTLRFAPYEPGTRFTRNRFGIPEPDVPRRTLLPARALDLLLLPLVAFDGHGNRLGMGGFQQVPRLAPAAWDVPLHGIVTERGAVNIDRV
jgi:5-formyltetrahydrofolate cyclo-ligase